MHVLELAAALKERGEAVLVASGGDGVLAEELAKRDVAFRKLEKLVHPIKPFQDWAAFKEIRALVQELKPDLVSTHSNKAGFLGRWAARLLNIPVLHTSHGFLFGGQENSPAGRFYRLMEKIGAKAADKVIAVSMSEFDAAAGAGVIPVHKMAVVYNGLPDVEADLRAKPAINPPRLVMVARFATPKDQATLLKALGGLKEKQWRLDLVGDGPGRKRAQTLAARLGIGERVSFLGVREDVPAVLAAAQVFVLSSRREGFPLSILEAMRAGLPVVASAAGGVGEAVADDENGLLFSPGRVRALRESLVRLLDSPQLRAKMGKAGRERFLEQFTLDKMVDETVAVYREVVGREQLLQPDKAANNLSSR